MAIKVRKMKRADLDDFWQVFSLILSKDFPGYSPAVVDYFLKKVYTKSNFDYWLKINWKIVLLALVDEQVAGFAVLDRPYGGVCLCRWLGVLSAYRNQGVGRQLIEKWQEVASQKGCHKIEVSSQPEARQFYQRVGLKMEGKRTQSYFGIDQYIYGRIIGQANDQMMVE